MIKKTLLLLAIFILSGCSTRYAHASDQHELKKLYSYYEEWQGAPFLYGGDSKDGIDASAFVQNAYRDIYGVDIPRTTKHQAELGTKVTKAQIRTGDIIFSKTGEDERHVSIYLEDGKFMHVSVIKGVSISTMDNPYWKKHFWMIKRVK